MKRYVIILVALLILPVICFGQKKQNKKRTNNKISLPTNVAPVFRDAIKCYSETVMVDNAPLVFKEYTSKTQDESVKDYDSFIFVNVEWPVKWRGYDFAPLQKALLSWMQTLNENTTRFNTVEDVLNAYSKKRNIEEGYFIDYTNYIFGCKYFSSDICIYEYNSFFEESSFFYYDLKNKKALNLYDLIISKSEAVQAIVNYFNIIKRTNSNYSKDSFKNDIDTLREKGVDDIFIEKDHITFFSGSSSYAVPITVAMPALTNRAKEIVSNMHPRNSGLKSRPGSRPIKGVLRMIKAREDLSYYTDRDIATDADGLNGIVKDYSLTKFRFYGEQCGDFWDYYIPKSKVKVEEYGYNDLLLSDIGDRISFISDDGVHKVQIIKINNGHKSANKDMIPVPKSKSKKTFMAEKASYVLCYEKKDARVWFFPLKVKGDHVNLYDFSQEDEIYSIYNNDRNIYNSILEPLSVDYAVYGYYTISSFFDEKGNMISDIPETEDELEVMTVAYLHDKQQLYISSTDSETEVLHLVKEITAKENADDDAASFVFYEVQEGQNLTKLAEQYGVTLNDIKEANPEIKDGNNIKIGQKIKIPKKEQTRTASTRKVNNEDDAAKKKAAAKEAAKKKELERMEEAKKKAAEEAKRKAAEEDKKPINHEIADGENLTKIAKRYGVSVQDIKRHNNITDESKVRSGSTLKIPKKQNSKKHTYETDEIYE